MTRGLHEMLPYQQQLLSVQGEAAMRNPYSRKSVETFGLISTEFTFVIMSVLQEIIKILVIVLL